MASTYSDLKIELIGTGEQTGSWGSTTNINLGTALEEAIVESADVAFSSTDVTLTLTNTNATQSARHLRLNLTGTSGGARNLILGSGCQIEKPYIINNGLADTVTVGNTTGTGVAVPAGKSMWVYNNGINVVEVTTHTPVSSGGTGAYTLTANNVIIGNGTSAVGFVAPGTLGNLLTSNGTTWTSAAPTPAGTVTSVSGTGTASGLTLSGTVTTSGSLTLSGTVNSLSAGTYAISISGNAATASNGGVTSVNGQTGAVVNTAFGDIGSYILAASTSIAGASATFSPGATVAGSTLLRGNASTANSGFADLLSGLYIFNSDWQASTRNDVAAEVSYSLSGTWRLMTYAAFGSSSAWNSGAGYGHTISLFVRIS